MGRLSAAAILLADRLASNSAASSRPTGLCSQGSRESSTLGPSRRTKARTRACCTGYFATQGVVLCADTGSEGHTGVSGLNSLLPGQSARQPQYKFRRRRGVAAQGILQEADYSVYQVLPCEEITEEFLWGRLRPLLGYLCENDIEKVQEALSLATDAHAGQVRRSGEPFITHPVEVARLLAELRMDKESLIAGLLHDTVEDNPAQITFEEIGVWFGQAVRTIVEGETKFSKLGQLSSDRASSADVKARDLQHLFLAMTKEVRIIVVKLADRLHNMRTLGSMPVLKQRKIAEETLQVFAPLARLLGLYSIKEELEELAFSYSKPGEYNTLKRHLEKLAMEQEPIILQAKQALEDMLREDGYLQQRANSVTITPTQKSVYSVHRKLEETQAQVSDVTDVAQLRVVIDLKAEQDPYLYGTGSQLCYHVMGLVHTKWAPIPGSIKDYIATPKRNGYQSLHTTVLPLGSTLLFPLEVQILTSKMQELAEFGIAGEKWVATDAQSYSFGSQDSDSDSELDVPMSKPWRPGIVADLLRMLPRLVGLNHNLVNGAATLAINGSVLPIDNLPARRRLRINGAAVSGLESSLAGRSAFVANGRSHPKAQEAGVVRQPASARLDRDVLKRREHWLKSIIEWQREFVDSLTAREFVDGITDDLLGRGVFVFTPSGDLMRLPKDSTAVDFAYHVHTDVGNQMVGAKVNSKLVAPERPLANAEVVEILTYNGAPTKLTVARHYEWAKFAKSKTARHKLAKFLKEHAHLLPDHLKMPPAGLSDRAVDGRAAPAGGECTMWLDVEGIEGPGLLAELARIIAKHGHNVQTYSGSVEPASGTLKMRFEVRGIAERCEAMCAEIGSAPCVVSWRLGCNMDSMQRQPA